MTVMSLNNLTIGSDGFLVICAPPAANYTFSGYPNNTCDITSATGGPADSNGDDSIAIVICSTDCTSWTILDIYGVPGHRGNSSIGSLFQYGHAERVPGQVQPKSIWNASDWYSLYGNYGANDMTPRRWSAVAVTPTLKPSSSVSCSASSSGDFGAALNNEKRVYVDISYQLTYNNSMVSSDSLGSVVKSIEIEFTNILIKALYTNCNKSAKRALRDRSLVEISQILGISANPADYISPGKARIMIEKYKHLTLIFFKLLVLSLMAFDLHVV
jgi:hypothetical protein